MKNTTNLYDWIESMNLDIAELKAKLAPRWNTRRNGNQEIDFLPFDNKIHFWWKGECGHEWKRTIEEQIIDQECPYCNEQLVLPGYNDYQTIHPYASMDWHPTKNGKLTPQDITKYYPNNVWWKCRYGHEWQSTPFERLKRRGSCPYCSNKKLLKGFNDFAAKQPELVEEWYWEKNEGLSPHNIMFNYSEKAVWWKCKKDARHVWQATPEERYHNTQCPYCSGEIALTGYDDLATLHPEIAVEWHPYKNNEKKYTPETLPLGKKFRFWWKCKKCGHEWQATTATRIHDPLCPVCNSNFSIETKDISLAAKNPTLAAEWHPIYNEPLTPSKVYLSSDIYVWWKCKAGHEWEASVHSRAAGAKCPYCTGHYPIPGETDLATTHLEIAYEWHPEKNGDLTPLDVTANSKRKVWWICKKGHEWETRIVYRTMRGTGCPHCKRFK